VERQRRLLAMTLNGLPRMCRTEAVAVRDMAYERLV
jgi:hypothetical protein